MNMNLVGKYSYIDSMIPIISENKFEVNQKAKLRAYRKEIMRNNMNSAEDLFCLVSVAKDVISEQNQNLMKLMYNRMEYLGFSAKKIPHKSDMSFREKVTFFCSNFMDYFDNMEDSHFIEEMKIQ